MSLFKGSGVAMITPFIGDKVNFKALDEHINHLLKGNTDALFVLGTTGEPCTMSLEEKESVLKFCIDKVNKRIPVIAGSGGNDTKKAIELSKHFEDMGADGLLVVTPYYNKCTQNGAVAYYSAISDSVNIPIIAYNVPTRTGFNIAPVTGAKIADIKNVIAIKEASGDIDQVLEIAKLIRGKIDLYSGDDSLALPIMSIGGLGLISVAANVIPKQIHDMIAYTLQNDYVKAQELHFKYNTFVKLLFSEVNPIPCKKALEFLGIKVGTPRAPLTEMEKEHADILNAEMKKLGLI